jgi:outer membrane protein OmpA-like peptidoglycan-associated protein
MHAASRGAMAINFFVCHLFFVIQTRYHYASFPSFMKGSTMQYPEISRKGGAVIFAVFLALSFSACDNKTLEASIAAPKAASSSGSVDPNAFDIARIPVSEKPLGKFPFFAPPKGHKYVSGYGDSKVQEGNTKEFDRYYFATGQETLHPIEGRIFRVELFDEKLERWEIADALRIERNYENAITAAGGVKVFDGKTDNDLTYQALDSADRERYAPKYKANKRQTYVIRKPDAEVWVEVSCGRYCAFTIAQKGETKQAAGLIPAGGLILASGMKAALDKEGHVALYIDFDTDKATVRPESEPIVAEIVKLLEENPDLKIRIEGHTDNTDADNHNQTLSERRAASIYGALLTKGIAQNRLQSAGFGASKPIADNATEKGKAKNQRMEIVKL